jgi:hypothetical protein
VKQPDHSILSMRVRIIEKIYHRTNNPNLATPLRRQKEDYWIRELGTATPYGCNDKINGIGILSSANKKSLKIVTVNQIVMTIVECWCDDLNLHVGAT